MDAAGKPQTSKDQVKQSAQHHRENGAKQERQNEAFPERTEINSRSYCNQTAAYNRSRNPVGGRDRETEQCREDNGDRCAERDREKELLRANQGVGNETFAGELLEQRLGQEDRCNRAGECCDRSPRNRRAVTGGAATVKGSDAFEVIVGAIRVSEETGRKEKSDEKHGV